MTLTQPSPVRTPGWANGVTPPAAARFGTPPPDITVRTSATGANALRSAGTLRHAA